MDGILFLVLIAIIYGISTLILLWVWNTLVAFFGLPIPQINFWVALALLFVLEYLRYIFGKSK